MPYFSVVIELLKNLVFQFEVEVQDYLQQLDMGKLDMDNLTFAGEYIMR